MKKNLDVVRAWKDPRYRAGLSEEDLASMPSHPAGIIDLDDADLGDTQGGTLTSLVCWTISTAIFSCAGTCPSETCDDTSIPISA